MMEDIVANSMRNYEEWKREQLRDQLAMAALTGIISAGSTLGPVSLASVAYAYADAAMRAREAK